MYPIVDNMQHNRRKLRQNLMAYFNEAELKNLCFDLQVDYETLSGDGKIDKVRELINYCERHHRTTELLHICRLIRPNLEW